MCKKQFVLLVFFVLTGCTSKRTIYEAMTENFLLNASRFDSIVSFFEKKPRIEMIKFEGDEFSIWINNPPVTDLIQYYNLSTNSINSNKDLIEAGVTEDYINEMHNLLRQIKCIGIRRFSFLPGLQDPRDSPIEIVYEEIGWGAYHYKLDKTRATNEAKFLLEQSKSGFYILDTVSVYFK